MNRETDERERHDVVERLRTLPKEAAVSQDLWPTIRDRIAVGGPTSTAGRSTSRYAGRYAGRRTWLRAAAALLIFATGAASGLAVGREKQEPPPVLDDALALAAEVQRTGSEYVAALAAFASMVDSLSLDARLQGRDVAVATLFGAVTQLAALTERKRPVIGAADDPTDPERVRF